MDRLHIKCVTKLIHGIPDVYISVVEDKRTLERNTLDGIKFHFRNHKETLCLANTAFFARSNEVTNKSF